MYRITIHGRAAHAGLEPEKGINATTEISRIALALGALENTEHGTTVVPTLMHSGSTTNTVPAAAFLDVDARSFLSAELSRVDAAIKSLRPLHPEARIEISGGINRPPRRMQSRFAQLRVVAVGHRRHRATGDLHAPLPVIG